MITDNREKLLLTWHGFSVAGDGSRNFGTGCSHVWNPLHSFAVRCCISRVSGWKFYQRMAWGGGQQFAPLSSVKFLWMSTHDIGIFKMSFSH